MSKVMLPYRDRRQAGVILADALRPAYSGRGDLLVLALPRGGVPVAYEAAMALEAPLDLMIVRKLGVPGQEELAMGAIASGGVRVLNETVIGPLGISDEIIERTTARERIELARRQREYRGDRPLPHVPGKCAILIDDGVATGASMRVAVAALRQQRPGRLVVAVPVAPPDTLELLRCEADDVICPASPTPFFGVGQWYLDFEQTLDQEIRSLLDQTWRRTEPPRRGS